MPRERTSTLLGDVTLGILLILAAILAAFCIIPFLLYLTASFLPSNMQTTGLSRFHFRDLTTSNYIDLIWGGGVSAESFWRYLCNTFWISMLNSIVVVSLTFIGAYVQTRFRFRGQDFVKKISLIGYLFPPVILIFPYSILLSLVGLLFSVPGLVIVNIAFCLPFASWLMIAFMEAVPCEYDRLAAADGANWWRTLTRIILPRMWPGIGAVFTFSIILSWNDVVLALRLGNNESYTLSAGVYNLTEGQVTTEYGVIAAGGLLVTALAVMIFCVIQWSVDRRLAKESEEL